MGGNTDDWLTPQAQALIDRARALAPRLAERAAQAERDGIVPRASVEEIREAGLFKVLQPQRWGGYEMDPRVFYSIQIALAEGCMATAWIYGVIGVHNWQLPLFPAQAQDDVWGRDPQTLIASTYMPVGKAEKVDGGYRLSGHWSWSSGCEHCEWIFLGGLLPRRDGSGALEHVTFLLPKSDFKIVHNFDVLGLRATASHDIVVENALVPEHRTQRTNDYSDEGCPGRQVNGGWLYRIPFIQVFQRAVSSACIGALDGAVTMFRERSATHVGKHGSKSAEDVAAQMAVTQAMMASDEAKLVLYRNYAQVVGYAKEGGRMPVEQRLMQRAQASAVPKRCAELVNEMLRTCAANGVFKSNPLERIFRDLHVARGHIANNADAYARAHGAVMLGLPNTDPFV
ncbi:MAG: acyl-CoA dehydrogenase family protein [Burkholderiales bacterium]|nr:acyl-CoA dehydrogenase family protein [Burkholderiales bacterium]MDE1926063.1 acyl-CoA dehydrogenase family protein [Burkholderiales bacterium]MDE2159550.1 acyl-CoA dehydrogenase family protein [Burkholderiales bacterium]MDE2502073.1 acyl-CoA dehydrogenase family protein [Burkholderiales bacterium]